MHLTQNQYDRDRRDMKAFIAQRIPEEGTRIILADGEGGEIWADLSPIWDEEDGWDLYFETNEPEWADIPEICDHFRQEEMTSKYLQLKKMTLQEWWRQQAIFPQKSASAAHQPNIHVQCAKSTFEESSGLLRLRRCVTVSGHSESTLRRAIKDGRLKAHTIGRGRKRPTYGIYRCDLEAFIEASRVQPPDSPRIPTIGVRNKSRHFD